MAATLAGLKAYMREAAARWTDPQLTDALATETSAQGRVCSPVLPGGSLGDEVDLVEALYRRVVVNLARRALPLGMTEASSDGGQRTYIPGRDPEVRRLEAPFRRMDMG